MYNNNTWDDYEEIAISYLTIETGYDKDKNDIPKYSFEQVKVDGNTLEKIKNIRNSSP